MRLPCSCNALKYKDGYHNTWCDIFQAPKQLELYLCYEHITDMETVLADQLV